MIRRTPCDACPYRRDVASGVWSAEAYDKLVAYDNETGAQPWQSFACHEMPTTALCHGWAVVHSSRGHEHDLLALRMLGSPEVPEEVVPLFDSGTEAAEHGRRDLVAPSPEAVETMRRLARKYARLRWLP